MNRKMLFSILTCTAGGIAGVASIYVCWTTIRHAPNPSPLEARVRARIAARAIDREWYRIVKEANRGT